MATARWFDEKYWTFSLSSCYSRLDLSGLLTIAKSSLTTTPPPPPPSLKHTYTLPYPSLQQLFKLRSEKSIDKDYHWGAVWNKSCQARLSKLTLILSRLGLCSHTIECESDVMQYLSKESVIQQDGLRKKQWRECENECDV